MAFTFNAPSHGLLVGDIGKPISMGYKSVSPFDPAALIWDQTNSDEFPSGVVTSIPDANNVVIATAGDVVITDYALWDTTDFRANGRWFYWEKSVGKWRISLPQGSYHTVAVIEAILFSGTQVTALVHEYQGYP